MYCTFVLTIDGLVAASEQSGDDDDLADSEKSA
jgi:hypothetical protein